MIITIVIDSHYKHNVAINMLRSGFVTIIITLVVVAIRNHYEHNVANT